MTAGEAMGLLTPCFGAIGVVWAVLSARITKLEQQVDDCNERWAREVRRGAALAAMTVDGPNALPPPEWDERTDVRERRALLEAEGYREGMNEALRRYLESTPPRQKLQSRPR